MSENVVFLVDLDAAAAPPAADSIRQLLALIDGLQSVDGRLDWRLTSVSLNSPLRAELHAFDPNGLQIPEGKAVAAAEAVFRVLDATNDSDPLPAIRNMTEEDRRRLRALLSPLKQRGGQFTVIVPGHSERVVRYEKAQKILTAMARPARRRTPELGSIEGQILAATTYYGNPALRVRRFISGEEVLCVFGREIAEDIGSAHTIEEVWTGQSVIVGGKITFDGSSRTYILHADSLKRIAGHSAAEALVRIAWDSPQEFAAEGWANAGE